MNLSRRVSWVRGGRGLNDFHQLTDPFLVQGEVDQSSADNGQWLPPVDIREEDQRFVIYADVPGVDPAQIEISMQKNVLVLRGERVHDQPEPTVKTTRHERVHGAFHRRFALPENVDAEGITANGKHGVLEIAIPKKAASAPRRIAIQTQH